MEETTFDFLIIGGGATALAFVDTLISDSRKTAVIVDRNEAPGGHWNTAYPFVRLHQPSSYYGVNSKTFRDEKLRDTEGLNRGLFSMASGQDVREYFHEVMQETLLPSGRVTYLPSHEYLGERRIKCLKSGRIVTVNKGAKVVDSTVSNIRTPATHSPNYKVHQNATLVTPNTLPDEYQSYRAYTVIGAGKTAMDTCLWLLTNNVDPGSITWIKPREALLYNREAFQPVFQGNSPAGVVALGSAFAEATSLQDFFDRLIAGNRLLTLGEDVEPTMFRGATITIPELHALRQIRNVVRKGYVVEVGEQRIVLERGSHGLPSNSLCVDCSATGVSLDHSPRPVFEGDLIRLHNVRSVQPVFSAAMICHVELTCGEDLLLKNTLCQPIPMPSNPVDFLKMELTSGRNCSEWLKRPQTVNWMRRTRLDWFGKILPPFPESEEERERFCAEYVKKIDLIGKKTVLLLENSPHAFRFASKL